MRKHHILYIAIINILSFICVNNTSALSYSSDVNIGFTFNPTISISVSGDLVIPNLTPGSSADSNSITVSVATNTAYGYTLTSTVGSSNSNNGNSTGNNSRNLVNSIDNNQSFTSLDYGSNIEDKTNFSDNTWGYSYSLNNGTTWKPYSGLPLYSDTTKSTVLYNTFNAASSISLDFKIAAKSSTTQASGEYNNVINFYAVPVPEPPLLYDVVQNMTKGTLADNNVKLPDTITQTNSGVYTYDPTVYGVASDASNDYPIYFYRGILDTTEGLGTYGSDGQADAWPNYVKLNNNTCWRIVRTTGSGGVKMIYNGVYGDTVAGSCANISTNASIGKSEFNNDGRQIVKLGYTYNDSYAYNDEINRSISTLFGINSNDSNTTNSLVKNFTETWYNNNNFSNYTSNLEVSPGYCGDRTIYNTSNILQSEALEIPQYSINPVRYNFGAFVRNMTKAQTLSLTCAKYNYNDLLVNRDKVDLYSVDGANSGNGRLSKPTALLTVDEMSFAGSGSSSTTNGSAYSDNSYLCSGDHFWSLSPGLRSNDGRARNFYLHSSGYIDFYYVDVSFDVRPAISLMHHIQVTGGNGTATSPWTIE